MTTTTPPLPGNGAFRSNWAECGAGWRSRPGKTAKTALSAVFALRQAPGSAPTLLKGPGAAGRPPVRAPDHLSGQPSGIRPGSVRRPVHLSPGTDPGRIPGRCLDGPPDWLYRAAIDEATRTDPGRPPSGAGVPRGGALPRRTLEVAHGRAGSSLPVPSRESGPPGLRGEAAEPGARFAPYSA